jgi:asparagine synthase (glutamine-hydrolysing)
MCGIYGMVSFAGSLQHPDRLSIMAERLRHRGPDDSGTLSSPTAMLGAERLRITDLRAEGRQPFAARADSVWLVANGAVYNAGQLRRAYADYAYRSGSDIEPLVPLYLDRGADGITAIDGMFALAIWDGPSRRLVLARDRAGEKPLFWTQVDSEIWFASEIQALLGQQRRRVDPAALVDYTTLGYVREPRTIFAGIHKVPAGTALIFSKPEPVVLRFWQPERIPVSDTDVDTATAALDSTLMAAVERQVTADVPVGVLTSGGVDSSLLAVMAARALAPERLRTFSVGFTDQRFDERQPAADLARLCGSIHSAIAVDDGALHSAFDRATAQIAEPLGDPALLPTMLLADHARRTVGVVLSGEGADELFGGYPTYVGHRVVRGYRAMPAVARRALTILLEHLPASHGKVTWDFLLRRFLRHAEEGVLARHVAWFGTGLSPAVLVAPPPTDVALELEERTDDLSRVMFLDYRTYLPDGLLMKIDRATMLVGLEARAPYLDREVTTFALGLPTACKVRGIGTKWLLKRVAQRYLPDGLVLRRKRGLSVPIATWITGGLRHEVDRLLDRDRLEAGGIFDAVPVTAMLAAHREGRANHARELWPLIVFERWKERWMGGT